MCRENKKTAGSKNIFNRAAQAVSSGIADLKPATTIETLIMLAIAGIIGGELSSPLWATDVQSAKVTLEGLSLKPVKVGGYGWFACGKGDVFATNFTAENAQGHTVSGTVCKGWLKGSTVRFD